MGGEVVLVSPFFLYPFLSSMLLFYSFFSLSLAILREKSKEGCDQVTLPTPDEMMPVGRVKQREEKGLYLLYLFIFIFYLYVC